MKRVQFSSPFLPYLFIAPQMAINVKCLIALKGRFWRSAELAPDLLSDGPVSLTWHGTDGQPESGPAAMVAFSGGNAADQCREWPSTSRGEHYMAALEPVYRDAFTTPSLLVRFVRDGAGRVTELSLGARRVRDLRLGRVGG